MKKIWNGKISSLIALLILAIKIVIDKVSNQMFFLIHRPNFKTIGKGTFFYRNLEYRFPKNIEIGKNCIINKKVRFGTELPNGKLIIGDNVSIAQNVSLDFTGDLIIGNDVTISESAIIYTHDHGFKPREIPKKRKLIIEDGVWIGANAIILHNVAVIGKSSIVAAGSIVVKNVPSEKLYGGNPAQDLKVFHNS